MKKYLWLFLVVFGLYVLVFLWYWEAIWNNFNEDPGSYLVQLACMAIPLFVTFYLFYIERNQRKQDEKRNEEKIKEQQKISNEMLERLEAQNTLQEKNAVTLEKTTVELRRLRRPEGILFMYKNYDTLRDYVSLNDMAEDTYNIVARVYALEQIYKEWDQISDEEVPLSILKAFHKSKNFVRQYISLLHLAWILLENNAKKNGEIEGTNIFQIRLNKPLSIVELIAEGLLIAKEESKVELNDLIEKKNISHLDSIAQLNVYMDIYTNTDKNEIKEKLNKDLVTFLSNLKTVYSSIDSIPG